MGQIGRFIDAACAAHPALMRKVLDRPFGTLTRWLNFDEAGEACGCLIGTMALCAGYNARRAESLWWGWEVALTPLGFDERDLEDVGGKVAHLARRISRATENEDVTPEAEAFTVELLKRRIARRLGVVYATAQAAQMAAAD